MLALPEPFLEATSRPRGMKTFKKAEGQKVTDHSIAWYSRDEKERKKEKKERKRKKRVRTPSSSD